ncbi:YheC/YheD family protein [Ammoniphilus resinae]|uniref:ATP-grasp domain-containing protein n=1 Tax=Ammoniphilus resinae TaxID=861532 RepID=A0ABS4GTP3_9BACL|nr:YheC/YheD family protein [Ammoniphilus resinae]MBP1933629.1 hypothetical protein [Ammoniphilus resinae]
MKLKHRRYISSKWVKHKALMKEPQIQQILPDTARLTKSTFIEWLNRYPSVFLKPVNGTGGKGIIQVKKKEDGYRYKKNRKSRDYSDLPALLKKIKPLIKSEKYLIQQGIDLLKVEGKPVDFRVLLLKPRKKWKVMGRMGKQAAKKRIVTNHCQGGKPLTLRKALKKAKGITGQDYKEMKHRVDNTARLTAETLGKRFKGLRELGLDLAIDKDLKIWILEANTKPLFNLFRYNPDKSLYPKIRRQILRIRKRR